MSIPEKSREVYGQWAAVEPSPLIPPAQILAYSQAMGAELGLLNHTRNTEFFRQFATGERRLNGSFFYSHCYGGYQFDIWAGQLGDGRVVNLGEVVSAQGKRWELQIKGAGFRQGPAHECATKSALRHRARTDALLPRR